MRHLNESFARLGRFSDRQHELLKYLWRQLRHLCNELGHVIGSWSSVPVSGIKSLTSSSIGLRPVLVCSIGDSEITGAGSGRA